MAEEEKSEIGNQESEGAEEAQAQEVSEEAAEAPAEEQEAEAPAEEPQAEEPEAEAAEAPPSEEEQVPWKERRRLERSRHPHEAGPQRSTEERAGERAEPRRAAALARGR